GRRWSSAADAEFGKQRCTRSVDLFVPHAGLCRDFRTPVPHVRERTATTGTCPQQPARALSDLSVDTRGTAGDRRRAGVRLPPVGAVLDPVVPARTVHLAAGDTTAAGAALPAGLRSGGFPGGPASAGSRQNTQLGPCAVVPAVLRTGTGGSPPPSAAPAAVPFPSPRLPGIGGRLGNRARGTRQDRHVPVLRLDQLRDPGSQ